MAPSPAFPHESSVAFRLPRNDATFVRCRADQEQFARVFRRQIGNRIGEFRHEIVMHGGQLSDDRHDIGPPASFARRNGHRAPVGKERRLAGERCAVHMVIRGADPFGERDRRARPVYVRVEAENRAPARLQKHRGMFGRALHQRFPVADPRNRHSLRYFLVPAQF